MRGENIKQSWDHDTGAYGRCSHCGRYSDDPKCLTDGFKCNCGMAAGFSGSFKRPLEGSTWCNPPKSEGEKQNSTDNTDSQKCLCDECDESANCSGCLRFSKYCPKCTTGGG